MLLTAPTKVPGSIASELKRLRPQRIVVLGGPGAVSETVKRTLSSYTSGTVDRWAGTDRYASSAAFSAKAYAASTEVVYLASGLGFPDALSGAPIAGKTGGPVLLTAPKSLPSSIATELKRLHPKKIVVLGGTGAISEAVRQTAAGGDTCRNPRSSPAIAQNRRNNQRESTQDHPGNTAARLKISRKCT